jgi:hypothetical protein
MSYNRYYYLLIFCFLLVAGCDDDDGVAVPTPEPPQLTEIPDSNDFNRRAFDILLYEDKMLIQAENANFHYRADSTRQGRSARPTRRCVDGVSTSFLAAVGSNFIDVFNTSIDRPSNGTLLRFDSISTGMSVPDFNTDFRTSLSSISEDGDLLLPYWNTIEEKMFFAIAKVDFSPAIPLFFGPPIISDIRTFLFDVPEWRNYARGVELQTVSGGFLLTLNEPLVRAVYRIDYDGTYERVFDNNLEQTFYHQGELYGTLDGSSNMELHRADADGRNWRKAYDLPDDIRFFSRFFPVEDDLFLQSSSDRSLLLVTELTEGSIRLETLDTPVLDSRTVTDMANFLGDTYVTTLSGIFRQEALSLRSSRRE